MNTTTKAEPSFNSSYLWPPVIGLCGVGYMLLISYLQTTDYIPAIPVTAYGQINTIFTMQALVLPVSFLVLGLIYFYDKASFLKFFRFGNINASAKRLPILGINQNDSWTKVGAAFTLILGMGTAIFMTIAVFQMGGAINSAVLKLFPLALLFSTTNAWSEEIFTRFTVVAGLDGKVNPQTKYWISAAIFGIPHYFGTPGGLVGSLMAGFMGWLLAKSIHETKGLFWAWFIHFVMDVIIFTANLLILASTF